ncbi:hypothetical protein SAMN05660916_02274 [Arthrobacter sp. 31Cvi3.1E]|nr:hypothetical protein SAMN05660916_02274 [Arthrobacter sp. 31Cvi3.1E]
MDTPRSQTGDSPRSGNSETPPSTYNVRQLSHGESAAIKDLTRRNGMLRVDRLTSTVRVQHDNGYHATYDFETGQLLNSSQGFCNRFSPNN